VCFHYDFTLTPEIAMCAALLDMIPNARRAFAFGGLFAFGFFGLLLVSSSTTIALEAGLWGSVGNWQVRVDSSLGHGCFMAAPYRNGGVVRLGFNNNSDTSYLLLGNTHWLELEKGTHYAVSLQFDGSPTVRLIGVATDSGFLAFQFDDTSILNAFAEKTKLNISYQGDMIAQLALTGTYAGMQMLRECNRQFSGGVPSD
jgi:hypothetical protein